jgi:hypothetical protein
MILKNQIIHFFNTFEIFDSQMDDIPHDEFWNMLLNKVIRGTKKGKISEDGFSVMFINPQKLIKICVDFCVLSIIPGPIIRAEMFHLVKLVRKIRRKTKKIAFCRMCQY